MFCKSCGKKLNEDGVCLICKKRWIKTENVKKDNLEIHKDEVENNKSYMFTKEEIDALMKNNCEVSKDDTNDLIKEKYSNYSSINTNLIKREEDNYDEIHIKESFLDKIISVLYRFKAVIITVILIIVVGAGIWSKINVATPKMVMEEVVEGYREMNVEKIMSNTVLDEYIKDLVPNNKDKKEVYKLVEEEMKKQGLKLNVNLLEFEEISKNDDRAVYKARLKGKVEIYGIEIDADETKNYDFEKVDGEWKVKFPVNLKNNFQNNYNINGVTKNM